MTAALITLALLYPQPVQDPNKPPPGTAPSYATSDLPSVEDPRLVHTLWIRLAASEEPQKCPRKPWLFPFVTAGYGRTDTTQSGSKVRFRVFSQYRNETLDNDPAVWATRLLLRLWDMNYQRLGIDNPEKYRRAVDVFLCAEGEPGGEQMFVNADLGTPDKPAMTDMNAVFIYQVQTITEPREFVREVAHEFGHASLPQIGPFKGPESWANGDVGERIYIKWLVDAMHAKKLVPADVAKANVTELEHYLVDRVDPLVKSTAASGPDLALLAKDSESAYNAYVALATYAHTVLPPAVMGRAFRITAGNRGTDFAAAIVDACAERQELQFTVPAVVGKKPLWLPLGKGTLVTGSVIERKGGWAKVAPTGAIVKVKNPQPKT